MLIKLIRSAPDGKAIFGRLLVDCENVSGFQSFKLQMDTLEHTRYAIPSGFYRLRMTYSPRFKEILPILDGVIGYREPTPTPYPKGRGDRAAQKSLPLGGDLGEACRMGIRIHAGNTIEDTTGCILVGEAEQPKRRLLSSRKALNKLREYLLNYQKENPNEEIYIEITEPDPYPLYNTPCPPELQKR